MNKLLLIFGALLFISIKANSQDKSAPASKNPVLKERAEKANAERKATVAKPENINANAPKKSFESKAKAYLDENDPYQGRKEEFLSQLIVKELPSDFPKYDKSYGVKNYNHIIDDYLSKHLDIVQPYLKTKLSK